ncbi:MAG: TolC family outer membrane protein [Gammaproteobacteria bacterium]|nr:TolC family outer membrane protein [Gammaproteobacteria bacterium]
MKTRFDLRPALFVASLLSTAPVLATDLATVYQKALQSDPLIREAEANRLAALEAKPQARAALLPQVSASAAYDDSSSDGSRTFFQSTGTGIAIVSIDSESDATRRTWDLTLRQNVFRWENWVALRRAGDTVAQAEADYAAARQELIVRTAETYFNVLAAQDTSEAAQATYDAIARQLEQSEKRFEVGLIAVTDVQEAKAASDSASAALIQAKRNLATTQERLRELTGEAYAELARPGTQMPLAGPDPANAEDWVRLALDQNQRLIASRLAADITRENVSAQRGGHYPSLDLVVSRSHFELDSDFSSGGFSGPNNSDSDDTSVTLQLTVPVFSGGATSSRVRQAEYQHQAARQRLERVARQTERETRDAYLGVNAEVARVRSLHQAVESANTALQATEAGYEVGTRTSVDVLDARRRLFEAQTNYARSRYDYLINVLRLRLAAGTLDAAGVSEINGLLTENVQLR